MHYDESTPASGQSTGAAGANPNAKLPAPSWARGAATPGGVPPMFAASTLRQPASGPGRDVLER